MFFGILKKKKTLVLFLVVEKEISTKHPNVRRRSKSSKINTLRCHPFNGQLTPTCCIITLIFHPPTQTKIC